MLVALGNKLQDVNDAVGGVLDFLGPMALRLYLAPVFWIAGNNKLAHMDSTIQWFGNTDWGLGLPAPALLAWMAVLTEVGGSVMLVSGLGIRWIEHDQDQPYQFDTDYDLIIVMWYVNLALVTRLCDCLAVGGYLLCEEHLITDQDVIGPNSTNYRVAPGSLREAVSGLDIMLCEETIENGSDDERVASARVVGRKR